MDRQALEGAAPGKRFTLYGDSKKDQCYLDHGKFVIPIFLTGSRD
jgi:hypothetical protein